jgi:hypothetical protein
MRPVRGHIFALNRLHFPRISAFQVCGRQAMLRSLSIFVDLPLIGSLSRGGGGDVEASLHIVGDGGETNLQASF